MTTIAPPRTVTLTIARQSLKTALSRLSGAVGSGVKALPVTQHVRLEVASNRLTLTATDFQAWARVSLSCDASDEAVVLLPAKRLTEIVSALPPVGAVTIALSPTGATITAGRARTDLSGLPAEEWPLDPDIAEQTRTVVTGAAFFDVLERVARHASDEPSRPALNGVLIEDVPGGLRLTATNGHRLARFRVATSPTTPIACTLHRLGIPVLARLFSGLAPDASLAIVASDRQFLVESDDARAVVALVDERFPNVESVLPNSTADRVVVCDTLALSAAIRRVAVVADDAANRITIELGEEIGLRADGDGGRSADAVAIDERRADRSHDVRRFGMNASYAIAALDTLTATRVAIAFATPERAVVFRDADQAPDDPSLVLVMPLRLL